MKLDLIDYRYLDFLDGRSFLKFILSCDSYLNRSNNQYVIAMRSIYLSPKATEGIYLFYPHNGLHFKVSYKAYNLHVLLSVMCIGIFSY